MIYFFKLFLILCTDELDEMTGPMNFIVEILWITQNQTILHLLHQSKSNEIVVP